MKNLVSAWKRAEHFCKDMPIAPFSVLPVNKKPLVAASNYQWLLDAERHEDEGNEILQDLVIMDAWASSLNRYIDQHQVANDDALKLALAAWKSRMIFNPLVY